MKSKTAESRAVRAARTVNSQCPLDEVLVGTFRGPRASISFCAVTGFRIPHANSPGSRTACCHGRLSIYDIRSLLRSLRSATRCIAHARNRLASARISASPTRSICDAGGPEPRRGPPGKQQVRRGRRRLLNRRRQASGVSIVGSVTKRFSTERPLHRAVVAASKSTRLRSADRMRLPTPAATLSG